MPSSTARLSRKRSFMHPSSSSIKHETGDSNGSLADFYTPDMSSSPATGKRQKAEELGSLSDFQPLNSSNRDTTTSPKLRSQPPALIVKQEALPTPQRGHPIAELSRYTIIKHELSANPSGSDVKSPLSQPRPRKAPPPPPHQQNIVASGSTVRLPPDSRFPADVNLRLTALMGNRPMKGELLTPTPAPRRDLPYVKPELKDDILNAVMEDPKPADGKPKDLDFFAQPDHGDDPYDEHGNFRGKGRDVYQGPQANADEYVLYDGHDVKPLIDEGTAVCRSFCTLLQMRKYSKATRLSAWRWRN
jgi:hypothetical protein